MKTDSLFYRLFQEFPGIFFELIARSPDDAAGYEFTSREVKQLSFRMDGLFLPTIDEPHQPFYLVEVQFQPDETLYYRLFGELFLYLKQYRLSSPWRIVVIYPTRSLERGDTFQFAELLASNRVQRIYLDELTEDGEASLGVGVVKLIIEDEKTVGEKAKVLIEQAKQRLVERTVQRNLIDLIETIIVYKLPHKSREEIEAMFGLSELKQTKVYQEAQLEAKLEAKLEAVPELLKEGLNIDQIARALKLPLELVQQEVKKSGKESEKIKSSEN
ncbi:MAG: Rpn family recombination-promoting nuclease/putative transposase [Microcystaceae cyanobacterium]